MKCCIRYPYKCKSVCNLIKCIECLRSVFVYSFREKNLKNILSELKDYKKTNTYNKFVGK